MFKAWLKDLNDAIGSSDSAVEAGVWVVFFLLFLLIAVCLRLLVVIAIAITAPIWIPLWVIGMVVRGMQAKEVNGE